MKYLWVLQMVVLLTPSTSHLRWFTWVFVGAFGSPITKVCFRSAGFKVSCSLNCGFNSSCKYMGESTNIGVKSTTLIGSTASSSCLQRYGGSEFQNSHELSSCCFKSETWTLCLELKVNLKPSNCLWTWWATGDSVNSMYATFPVASTGCNAALLKCCWISGCFSHFKSRMTMFLLDLIDSSCTTWKLQTVLSLPGSAVWKS